MSAASSRSAANPARPVYREQVTFYRAGAERTFNVQITIEDGDDGIEEKSYVVTVDDITDLVAGAALLGLGRRGAPHRPRDQEPADARSSFRPSASAAATARSSPRTARSSTSAPTPSSGRSRISAAWSTSSRPSPACRSRTCRLDGPARGAARGLVPGRGQPRRHRLRARFRQRAADGHLRQPADGPGVRQRHQERRRGDRGGPSARPGEPASSASSPGRRMATHPRRRASTTARVCRARIANGCSSPI